MLCFIATSLRNGKIPYTHRLGYMDFDSKVQIIKMGLLLSNTVSAKLGEA